MKLGLSGSLTRATIQSPLTPLFLLAAILLGLLATLTIAREEEPQISVPMVDIRVQVPGLAAPDAVELVAKPLETIVRSIDGVEHTYTQVEDDGVLVTARFYVGTDPDAAAVRINEKLHANWDRILASFHLPAWLARGESVRTTIGTSLIVRTLTSGSVAAGPSSRRVMESSHCVSRIHAFLFAARDASRSATASWRSKSSGSRLTASPARRSYSAASSSRNACVDGCVARAASTRHLRAHSVGSVVGVRE